MSSHATGRARAWLATPVATRPSWIWAAVAAATIAVVTASMPLSEDAGRSPDRQAWADPSHHYGDYALFVGAGKAVLSGHLGLAYSDHSVQSGPLALAWAAGLAGFLRLVHGPGGLGFLLSVFTALLPAVYAAGLWSSRHRPPRSLYVAAVGVLVVLTPLWQLSELFTYQHPTYLWVPALWLLAADAARRGRATTTALLLVGSCALETWGVLAVPVLLLALPAWRLRVQAGVTWAVGTAVVWAPFVLSGQFHMLEMTWLTAIDSPVVLLLGSPEDAGWEVRATQGAIIALASIVAWLVGRGRTDAATVATAVVVWTRVVTDTIWFPYYQLALDVATVAVVLAAVAAYLRTRRPRTLLAVGLGLALVFVAQAEILSESVLVNTLVPLALLVGLVVAARDVPAAPPDPALPPVASPSGNLAV